MEYAQLGGSDLNGQHHDHQSDLAQIDAENRYNREQQSLRARLQRLQQQQQFAQTDTHAHVHWAPFDPPISTYPQSSNPPAPYSPDDGGLLLPTSGYTDIIPSALCESYVGFNPIVDTTNSATLQPRAYGQLDDPSNWQPVPSSVPIESQIPVTTEEIGDCYYPLDLQDLNSAATGQIYNDFGAFVPDFDASQEQQFEPVNNFGSPGVQLWDRPAPEYDFVSPQPEPQWSSPQQRFEHTPDSIINWFSENYASRRDPPLSGKIMSEQSGGIWCKICRPQYTFLDPLSYRQHKEEIHGIDFKTGYQYWAPLEVRPISGVVGIGYEGYCPTCLLWIPMDLTKPDFNWFHHASKCQDKGYDPKKTKSTKSRPASPLERWSSSASEDDAAPIDSIKKEAIRRARQGEFLRPRPPFASNSNSNPSDETNSDIFSSGSSQSVRTSNSGSGSSMGSAMSQHSLESRRKKILRTRKRKGARSSNQGLRVYQCTFCMADFANFGDWRRHEEVIHLVLDKWVCAPEGQYKNGTRECVYCEEVHAEQSNIPNKCNASYCHGKGPADRVFARKDHLKQHLKRMHGIHSWRPSFDAWSKKAKGPRQSRCGFCGQTFDDWQQRMQHIAWEFKNGQKMTMWEGDWGLESAWMMEQRLGGAVLPKNRPDHISKSLKTAIDKLPILQQPTPDSGPRVRSAPPGTDSSARERGKRGLQRKPRLSHMRDIQQQQQQQQPQPQLQTQSITPPMSWSLPSSASGPHTTPPSRQSPLAPYSTNNLYTMSNSDLPTSILPRPPESVMGARGGGNGGSGGSGGEGARRATRAARSFQCPCCSLEYTRQDNLKRHMKSHFGKGSSGDG